MAKEVGELDFHTVGATEKVVPSVASGLSDGPHTLTLRVKREHKGRGSGALENSIRLLQDPSRSRQHDRKWMIVIRASNMVPSLWTGLTPNSYGGTEKYADINNSDSSVALEAQATISYRDGYLYLWLEGLTYYPIRRARVTLDGKEMPSLDLHFRVRPKREPLLANLQTLTKRSAHPDIAS